MLAVDKHGEIFTTIKLAHISITSDSSFLFLLLLLFSS